MQHINTVFSEFIESDGFRLICRGRDSKGGKYRLYASRFKRGELKPGAMVEILQENGFEIFAKLSAPPQKTSVRKPGKKIIKPKTAVNV